MKLEIFQVDAFTAKPFGGNPAAVVPLESWLPDHTMRSIAAENNLSETAFFVKEGDRYHIRWFTPTIEVNLCGHATLAAAHVLWEDGRLAESATARFHTRSGVLFARRVEDGWMELDFPALTATPADTPEFLVEALGVEPVWVGRSRHDLLVEMPDGRRVRAAHIVSLDLQVGQ